MKLCNIGHNFDYEMEKLIRLFLPFEKIEVLHTVEADSKYAVCEVLENGEDIIARVKLCLENSEAEFSAIVDKKIADTRKETQHELGRQLFYCFEKITGYRPDWGILTGVRPAKLFSRYCNEYGTDYAESFFKNKHKSKHSDLNLLRKTGYSKILLFFPVLLRNISHTSLYKFKAYSMMVCFMFVVK